MSGMVIRQRGKRRCLSRFYSVTLPHQGAAQRSVTKTKRPGPLCAAGPGRAGPMDVARGPGPLGQAPGARGRAPGPTNREAISFAPRGVPLTVYPLARFAEVAHRALGVTFLSSHDEGSPLMRGPLWWTLYGLRERM